MAFVGVERSSKVYLYYSKKPLLVSRLVFRICQVKPNALRHLELWLVGFRYIYFYECVIEKQVFLGRLKGIWSFTALPNLRVRLYFYYRTHVIKGNQETDKIFLAFFWKMLHNFSTLECTRIPTPHLYRIVERKLAKLQRQASSLRTGYLTYFFILFLIFR